MAAFLLATIAATAQDDTWRTYVNARFGFLLDYPAEIFTSMRQSANGDGVVLTSADGKARLSAYAINAPQAETPVRILRQLADREEPAETTYVRHGRTWGVISGYVQGRQRIFYTRLTLACQGRVRLVMDMEYPSAHRQRYDALLARLADSMRPGPSTCGSR